MTNDATAQNFGRNVIAGIFLGKLNEHDKLAKVTEEIEKMKEAQVHFLTICEVLFLSS